MARHKQDGLIYFPFDTDFFYADKRIKRFHAKFGNDGIIFYIYLLTEIYRNGYYISWDEDTTDDIETDLRLKEGFIEQVMTYLRGRSLLEMRTLSTGVTIITSPGIQKRYQEAIKSRRRDVYVDSEIWLLNEKETASYIKVTVNESKSCGNESKSCGNESKSCGNDIKESKVKESKGKREIGEGIGNSFDKFWSIYPLKKNLLKSKGEYIYALKTTPGLTEEMLISAGKNYAESLRIKKIPDRYIKHADNWIRESSWIDYLPENYKREKESKTGIRDNNNFERRSYDYDDLEDKLINANFKDKREV